MEFPDRRIKPIVLTMCSSGCRLGAWDFLKWSHIIPVEREGKIIAAKIIIYAGEPEEYFSFITAEAYVELKKWMDHRQKAGEQISDNSWVMRQV